MKIWIPAVALWILSAGAPFAQETNQLFCPDYYSRQVTWLSDGAQLKALRAAYKVDGTPVIIMNALQLSKLKLSPLAQKFVYLHECAHHVLGHVVKPPQNVQEFDNQVSQADCWAANRFYYYSPSGADEVMQIQAELNALPREKWVNMPGPVRVLDFKETCHFRDLR